MRVVVESLAHVRAVALRETLEVARRKTPFVLRSLYAVLVGITVFGTLMLGSRTAATGGEMAFVSSMLYALTVGIQSLLALVMGIVLGVASIQSERQNYTLGLMTLSGIHHWEALLGKLVAQVGLACLVFISIVPLLGLIGWGGGVDYAWLWKMVLLSVALVVLGSATGLAFGLRLRGGLAAVGLALVFAVALVLFPLMVGVVDENARDFLAEFWIWNPTVAVASQGQDGTFWIPLALQFGIAAILMIGAAIQMARAAGPGSVGGARRGLERLDRFMERINLGNVRLDFLSRGHRPRGNPVVWLSRTTGGLGSSRYWVRLGLASLVAAMLAASWSVRTDVGSFLIPVIVGAAGILLAAMAGASAIAGERTRKSLSNLLATPLSGTEIAVGKARVGLLLVLVTLLPVATLLLLVSLMVDQELSLWILGVTALLCAEAFAIFGICFASSLFLASPLRALVLGVSLWLGVNLIPIACRGVFWSLLDAWSILPLLGMLLLLAGAVASGVISLMQREVSPFKAFLGRTGMLTFAAGLGNIFTVDPSGRWGAGGGWFDVESFPLFGVIYLLIVGHVSIVLVKERFDDALERSP